MREWWLFLGTFHVKGQNRIICLTEAFNIMSQRVNYVKGSVDNDKQISPVPLHKAKDIQDYSDLLSLIHVYLCEVSFSMCPIFSDF